MNDRIEQRDDFEVFGVETEICTVDHQDFIDVPKFWKQSRENDQLTASEKLQASAIKHRYTLPYIIVPTQSILICLLHRFAGKHQ